MSNVVVIDREGIRDELVRLLQGAPPAGAAPTEILGSWRESIAAGLQPDHLEPPFDDGADMASDMLRAGWPVADRLAEDLDGTDISVVLTDADARVVARWSPTTQLRELLERAALSPGRRWRVDDAGTNALGIASLTGSPALVVGPEHFMEPLSALTTAASPIVDARTGQTVGAIALVCPATSTNALLLPVARRVADEIGQRLATDGIQEITADEPPSRPRHRPRTRALRSPHEGRPTLGWASLTPSELMLSELIADGLTNKEVAARLYVSRHTVDAHLRHIFRKLDINSRVDLARVVATHRAASAGALA
jgi:DNA-binding CsgD family transcriptional regulator